MGSITDFVDKKDATIKQRFAPTYPLSGSWRQYSSGTLINSSTGSASAGFGEETCSLYHHGWRRRIGRLRVRDVGGPFFNRKVKLYPSQVSYDLKSGLGPTRYEYTGQLFPCLEAFRLAQSIKAGTFGSQSAWTSRNAMSRKDLKIAGQTLMLRASPNAPNMSIAASAAEMLSEGLFSVPLKSLVHDPNPAGEFLNYQFGVLPVVGDIQSYRSSYAAMSKTLTQWHRDAGKLIRRRRKFPETSESVSVSAAGNAFQADGSPMNAYLQRNGVLTTTTHTKRDVWFSGAFQYFIPEDASAWALKVLELNRVFGIVPTPETVWELTPFSWLSDWFTNSQEAIRNLFLLATDGSVLVRGYVMAHSVITTEYVWTGDLKINGSWVPSTIVCTLEEEIKQRESTRAFGVDFTGVDFSDLQLAILTALGLSKR